MSFPHLQNLFTWGTVCVHVLALFDETNEEKVNKSPYAWISYSRYSSDPVCNLFHWSVFYILIFCSVNLSSQMSSTSDIQTSKHQFLYTSALMYVHHQHALSDRWRVSVCVWVCSSYLSLWKRGRGSEVQPMQVGFTSSLQFTHCSSGWQRPLGVLFRMSESLCAKGRRGEEKSWRW